MDSNIFERGALEGISLESDSDIIISKLLNTLSCFVWGLYS